MPAGAGGIIEDIQGSITAASIKVNQSQSHITLTCDNGNINNIKVYSISGSLVKNISANSAAVQVNTSDLNKGVHIVSVSVEGEKVNIKIVI